MKVFRVVVDSSCLIGLAQIDLFKLLKELGLDCALIDERTARSMADLMNVNTMGVLGIIDLAIKKGFSIDKKKVIDRLKDLGFRISDKLYKQMFPDSK